ncbi:MAG: SGNH/GDSL hydrolase family protein [Myxococcales bacterium]|nr:SGNH/GDSL hydrolase family protein [Myxococcales bacterium]
MQASLKAALVGFLGVWSALGILTCAPASVRPGSLGPVAAATSGADSRAQAPRLETASEAASPSRSAPSASAAPSVAPAPAPEPEPAPLADPILESVPVPRHSILPPSIAAGLREISSRAPRRRPDVFAKMGGSSVVSRGFLYCFNGEAVELDGRESLRPTIEFFRGGNAAGRSPFTRDSMAAHVGWSLRHGLTGRPPRVVQEVDAIGARYAFVLFGGNDVQARNDLAYAERLLKVVDALIARGVIPILGATLPRNDAPVMDAWARRYNRWSWAIAQIRGIPYVDYYQAFQDLPGRGLARDGVHPNILLDGRRGDPCVFTEEGLNWGHNVRNLLSIESLDRIRQVVVEGVEGLDAEPAPLRGAGTLADPVRLARIPYAEEGRSEGLGDSEIASYSCPGNGRAPGPERVLRLVVDRPMRIRASVLGRRRGGSNGPRIYLLGAEADPRRCVEASSRDIVKTLQPGIWHLVIEAGRGAEGLYHLAISEEPAAS